MRVILFLSCAIWLTGCDPARVAGPSPTPLPSASGTPLEVVKVPPSSVCRPVSSGPVRVVCP